MAASDFLLTGHRGAPTRFPENTVRSILGAIACGATAVEVDVRVTCDDVLVLSHDPTLERIANKPVDISQVNLEELQEIAFKGERIATLSEVAKAVKGVASLDLDVKIPDREAEIVQEISAHGDIRRTLFTSFSPEVVSKFKLVSSELRTGLIEQAAFRDAIEAAMQVGASCILPEVSDLDGESLEMAQNAGLAVVPWTVDDPKVALDLLRRNVDGLITDDPCRLAGAVLDWRNSSGQ